MTTATVHCACPPDASGPWDCVDCPAHGEEASAACEAEHKAEMDAENAWLRAAEAGYPGYDYDPNEATDPAFNGMVDLDAQWAAFHEAARKS